MICYIVTYEATGAQAIYDGKLALVEDVTPAEDGTVAYNIPGKCREVREAVVSEHGWPRKPLWPKKIQIVWVEQRGPER